MRTTLLLIVVSLFVFACAKKRKPLFREEQAGMICPSQRPMFVCDGIMCAMDCLDDNELK